MVSPQLHDVDSVPSGRPLPRIGQGLYDRTVLHTVEGRELRVCSRHDMPATDDRSALSRALVTPCNKIIRIRLLIGVQGKDVAIPGHDVINLVKTVRQRQSVAQGAIHGKQSQHQAKMRAWSRDLAALL